MTVRQIEARVQNALTISGIIALVLLAGSFLFSSSNNYGITEVVIASGPSCERLEDLFFNSFDCCGTGSGSQQCSTIETAYSRAECGILSCLPPLQRVIAFTTPEGFVGDLDGDGRFNRIIRYHDISTGATDIAGIGLRSAIDGNIIAFETQEHIIGLDINGDGDTDDLLIRYHDTSTQTTNTGAIGVIPSISGNKIAFITRESWVSQDLNGDGDTKDGPVLRYYDISTGTTTNTGVVGVPGRGKFFDDNIIAFSAAGTIQYYDISTGTTTDTGVVGFSPVIDGSIIVFSSFEFHLGQDLNGDGDTTDFIVRYYDISTGITVNIGVEGSFGVSGNIIEIITNELSAGQDINGDGAIDNIHVIRFYNIPTGTIVNTDLLAAGADIRGAISNGIIAFATFEGYIGPGGKDLNGDQDKADVIIQHEYWGSSEYWGGWRKSFNRCELITPLFVTSG